MTNRKRREFLKRAAAGAGASMLLPGFWDASPTGWEQVPEILKRVLQPLFPARDFDIPQYGAAGDGVKDCSAAFAGAIEACRSAGGGRVTVPPGRYLTGPIHLQSRVNLHVENGATILFRTDSGKPLIAAIDCENIAVTGAGTLDGQSGHATASFIQFYRCQNVVVGRFSDRADGVTIERSPGAGIHPVLCTNVTVRRVRISSLGPGSDGCDLESCKDVLIENTLFNIAAAGIAIRNGPSENIIVRGCELRDGHEGVTISGDETGGVRNVFVDRCTMDSPHLDRAVRLTHNARDGLLEHIYVRDVNAREATDAVLAIDVPIVRDVEALRVTSNKSTYGIAIRGQEQSTVDEVRLIDCSFDGVQKGNVIERANAVRFQNTRMNGAVVRF